MIGPNFRFIAADGSYTDVDVIEQDGAWDTGLDFELVQSPGVEQAFLLGSGRESADSFTVTLLIRESSAALARAKAASLYDAASAAVSLARIARSFDGTFLGVRAGSTTVLASSTTILASSATESWYRALWGDGMSVANRELTPYSSSAQEWNLKLTLRPLFAGVTNLPARTEAEYTALTGSAIFVPPAFGTTLTTESGDPILTEDGRFILVTAIAAPAEVTPPGRLDFSLTESSQYIPLL